MGLKVVKLNIQTSYYLESLLTTWNWFLGVEETALDTLQDATTAYLTRFAKSLKSQLDNFKEVASIEV